MILISAGLDVTWWSNFKLPSTLQVCTHEELTRSWEVGVLSKEEGKDFPSKVKVEIGADTQEVPKIRVTDVEIRITILNFQNKPSIHSKQLFFSNGQRLP